MKLKVCGIKYSDNGIAVAKLVPDFMGFIFYARSKRFVGADFEMPEIPSSINKVGVFVNDEVSTILEKAKTYNLNYVQLHGDESPAFCKLISNKVKVIKAFGVDDFFDFSSTLEYENYCEYFLFDTKTQSYGGSGMKFNWNILSKYIGKKLFFLSGGIGLEEVVGFPKINSKLFAIDVNSKFEISPGLKDINKLKILKNELSSK